jgi:CDP-glucose 4,6-dehydratase
VTLPFAAAYAGRSVLVTGHTGFKGSWLSLWLADLGAHVHGYALAPPTDPALFVLADVAGSLASDKRSDIRDRAALAAVVDAVRPDVVFHLAARTIVREGYADPVGTFDVNVTGTAVLLDVLREAGRPTAVVVVTSDKCYANDGRGVPFSEDDPLGGDDPYSASKAGQELVAAAFRASYFAAGVSPELGIALATARAGNVIGGGDWTADGLVADLVRALADDRAISLRYPDAIRPWQHVLEPLSGYLTLGARLLTADPLAAEAWNFGPDAQDDARVRDVVERFLRRWGTGRWVDDSAADHPHEAGVLRLSAEKAASRLAWRPRWRLAEAVDRTVAWYRTVAADPATARSACLRDIEDYSAADDARAA